MREQKRIYEMSDREWRAYKRKIRRQREQRRKVVSALIAVCLMAVCVVSYHALITSANSGAEEIALKYYTGITVKSGDTLWNLADAYIDYTQYKDKEAYINEVCSINNLSETAEIRAGQRLIVPYYSEEFVK